MTIKDIDTELNDLQQSSVEGDYLFSFHIDYFALVCLGKAKLKTGILDEFSGRRP